MLAGTWSIGRAGEPETVRDRLWVWAHEAGVYTGQFGLHGRSRITPAEGAAPLGLRNMIFVRYEGKPSPPFERHAAPLRGLDHLVWSMTGAGGMTSEAERGEVLALAAGMRNLSGVILDDFFQIDTARSPEWLAANGVAFPVTLALTFPRPLAPDELELVQSNWPTGDYRRGNFAVDLAADDAGWQKTAQGRMPNAGGSKQSVRLPGRPARGLRLRILNSQDARGAMSCGLSALRLRSGGKDLPLEGIDVQASSEYPGHPARAVLGDMSGPAPAALSVAQLRDLRRGLDIGGRRLAIWVTLYTHQLTPAIRPHLDLCDVITFWTWQAKDLENLETNLAMLKTLAPGKAVVLGCYMWDFGAKQPMPIRAMRRQCELGLRWLKEGRIRGLIFLGTPICDLDLEAVAWTRKWIKDVTDRPLPAGGDHR